MGSILFFKLLTEFINIMIHGLLLLSVHYANITINVIGNHHFLFVTITRATIIKSIIKVLSIKHFDVYAIS